MAVCILFRDRYACLMDRQRSWHSFHLSSRVVVFIGGCRIHLLLLYAWAVDLRRNMFGRYILALIWTFCCLIDVSLFKIALNAICYFK